MEICEKINEVTGRDIEDCTDIELWMLNNMDLQEMCSECFSVFCKKIERELEDRGVIKRE